VSAPRLWQFSAAAILQGRAMQARSALNRIAAEHVLRHAQPLESGTASFSPEKKAEGGPAKPYADTT